MKFLTIISAMAIFLWQTGDASAFVVQNAGSALSYNNIGRDRPSVKVDRKELPGLPSYGGDTNVDHIGIADKLIGSSKQMVVDFRGEKTTLFINVPSDYVFNVILSEPEGSRWIIDGKKDFIVQENSQVEEGVRIVSFRSLKPGQVMVYLDNMTTEAPYKSLQSKVLQVRIVK